MKSIKEGVAAAFASRPSSQETVGGDPEGVTAACALRPSPRERIDATPKGSRPKGPTFYNTQPWLGRTRA